MIVEDLANFIDVQILAKAFFASLKTATFHNLKHFTNLKE